MKDSNIPSTAPTNGLFWDNCTASSLCPYLIHRPIRVTDIVITGILGAGTAQWLERRTRDRKAASSCSDRSCGRIFFIRVNVLC